MPLFIKIGIKLHENIILLSKIHFIHPYYGYFYKIKLNKSNKSINI